MISKNASRAEENQTSTPLNDNKGDAFFATFANVSTIPSKCRRTRHPVIELPATTGWERPVQSPQITDVMRKKLLKPSKNLGKRRPDTPLKSLRKPHFSYTPVVSPLKSKLSSISSSLNVHSKFPDIKKLCPRTVNKHLLFTGEKPRKKNEEREDINKKIVYSTFCKNTSYNRNSIADSGDGRCSKEILHELNVSERRISLGKEYCDKLEVFDHTYDDSYEDVSRMIDITESESLGTSHTIESSRKENVSTVDYFSGLDILSGDCIDSSALEELSEFSNDTIIPSESVWRYLEEKSNAMSSKYNANLPESLPEATMPVSSDCYVNEEKGMSFNLHKISSGYTSNEIGIGKSELSRVNGEILDGQQPRLLSTFEATIGSNVSLDQQIQANLDVRSSQKLKKSRKTNCKRELQAQDYGVEKIASKKSVLLRSPNSSITTATFHEIFGHSHTKVKEPSKNPVEYQKRDMTVSNILKIKRNPLWERHMNESNWSGEGVNEITGNKNAAADKSEIMHGNRKQQKKSSRPKRLDGEPVRQSNNIQSGSEQKRVSEMGIFQNDISKRTGSDRGRASMYPSTSTLFHSDEEKLPVVLKPLSPIQPSKVKGKSASINNILTTRIKAKKTYAKYDQKTEKEISKWESFLKKPSRPRENNNDVESSISKSSGGDHLFDSPSADVNEGIPLDDILILWNRFRRGKASRRRRKRGSGRHGR